MKKYVRKKEEGVSPVIATILMVAITVVLAATLYLMLPKSSSSQTTSSIQFVAQKTGTNSWKLDIAANDLNPIDLKFAILDSNGNVITNATNGALSGVQFPTTSGTPSAGVTWNDLNGDGKVNTGDTVVIDISEVTSGCTFKITAGATGDVTLP